MYLVQELYYIHCKFLRYDVFINHMIRLSGSFPFTGTDSDKILKENYKCKVNYPHDIWYDVSAEAQNLVQGMMNPQSSKRLSTKEALNSSFLKKSFLHNGHKTLNHGITTLNPKIISSELKLISKNSEYNVQSIKEVPRSRSMNRERMEIF